MSHMLSCLHFPGDLWSKEDTEQPSITTRTGDSHADPCPKYSETKLLPSIMPYMLFVNYRSTFYDVHCGFLGKLTWIAVTHKIEKLDSFTAKVPKGWAEWPVISGPENPSCNSYTIMCVNLPGSQHLYGAMLPDMFLITELLNGFSEDFFYKILSVWWGAWHFCDVHTSIKWLISSHFISIYLVMCSVIL